MNLWPGNRSRLAFFSLLVPFIFSLSALVSSAVADVQSATGFSRPNDVRFTMRQAQFQVEWAVDRDHELACGGSDIAGGLTSGSAVFSHLGRSTVEASAAWDVGNLIDNPQYHPVGPAGGPVAPVLGPDDYPYEFHYDPRIDECASGLVATGDVRITAANGDELHGSVQGGEAHRLDFLQPGDGVESFVEVDIMGGTGRFENATGSFTMHTIVRFDPGLGGFVIDLAELLPGGTLSY